MSQVNRDRYIHYRDHVRNPHINYIRSVNCKYCKQDKRDFYGLQHSRPHRNRNHHTNMNLLNFSRVRNILNGNNNRNTNNINIPNNINLPNNINTSFQNPSVINHRHNRQSRFRRLFNPIRRILNRNVSTNNTNIVTNRPPSPINPVLRNNYVNESQPRNNLNIEYFMNNLGIQPIQEDEIQDFEELTDVEVKTLHETVNKETEIEVFYESKKGYCTICCEDIIYSQIIRKFKCGHTFHYKCIDEWLENNTKCPVCRYDINR